MGGKGESPAIGIDLGTTYSCVGVWQNDHVEIIPNDQGNRMTPSYVDFNDKERLIGDATKNQVARNPTYSIFGIHPILQSPNHFFFFVVNFFFLFYLLQLPKLTITNKIDLAQVVCGLIIDGLASSWIGFRFKVKKKKTNLTQPNRT